MTRVGGFLCFMFISLPDFTEHALYFRVRQSQIVKCKFLILKYFSFRHFHVFLKYQNIDQFQFLLWATCKKLPVYVSDYFRGTRS